MILIKFLMQRNAINQISKALSKKWCLFNITLIVSIGDAVTFRCYRAEKLVERSGFETKQGHSVAFFTQTF